MTNDSIRVVIYSWDTRLLVLDNSLIPVARKAGLHPESTPGKRTRKP